jgi:hypothetical protein
MFLKHYNWVAMSSINLRNILIKPASHTSRSWHQLDSDVFKSPSAFIITPQHWPSLNVSNLVYNYKSTDMLDQLIPCRMATCRRDRRIPGLTMTVV